MQKGFMNKHTRKLIHRIKNLLDINLFNQVIFTKFVNSPHSHYVNLLGYQKLQKSPETEIVDELEPYAQITFKKEGYGPFVDGLERFLKRKKITHLYFVGVDTNACILKGVVDAFDKGYIPFVLGYYCGSHSGAEFHHFALKNLQKLIGKKQIIKRKLRQGRLAKVA